MKKKDKKIGIGIIGCGDRLRVLASLMLEKTQEVQISALNDPSKRSVQKAVEEIAPQAVVYDDYNDLVNDNNINWIMIGSWNCFHREHITSALKAGKNVFCEKPLATTVEDCLLIKEAVERSNNKFFIGFTLRYSPHYRKIKELLDNNEIGKIISFEFNETLPFDHVRIYIGKLAAF